MNESFIGVAPLERRKNMETGVAACFWNITAITGLARNDGRDMLVLAKPAKLSATAALPHGLSCHVADGVVTRAFVPRTQAH